MSKTNATGDSCLGGLSQRLKIQLRTKNKCRGIEHSSINLTAYQQNMDNSSWWTDCLVSTKPNHKSTFPLYPSFRGPPETSFSFSGGGDRRTETREKGGGKCTERGEKGWKAKFPKWREARKIGKIAQHHVLLCNRQKSKESEANKNGAGTGIEE